MSTMKVHLVGIGGQLGRLDRVFEAAFVDQLRHATQQRPLGFAMLMRYAWQKYNEVTNLRMIARGAAAQIPKERIGAEVMYG